MLSSPELSWFSDSPVQDVVLTPHDRELGVPWHQLWLGKPPALKALDGVLLMVTIQHPSHPATITQAASYLPRVQAVTQPGKDTRMLPFKS